jgi:hypothetical protein
MTVRNGGTSMVSSGGKVYNVQNITIGNTESREKYGKRNMFLPLTN